MLKTCLFLLVVLTVLAGCNLSGDAPLQTVEVAQQTNLTCDELVTTALSAVESACSGTQRNQVCYGSRLVEAEFKPQVTGTFSKVGDIIDLLSLKLIRTAPLDEASQTWGVAMVKAQANIPDTLPGQNVTFLLYGGAALDNVSPDMRAVIVRTNVTGVTCADAPTAAVMIQSPNGAQAALNINGADVTLGSTIYVTAEQNAEMNIATIEGSAIVQASGVTQIVNPGAQVSLPLGSTDGLRVVGPPSEPEPFDVTRVQSAPITLLERDVPIPSPIPPQPTNTPSSSLPPVTDTLPPVTLALPPTATAIPCIPRADWTASYTIAAGDTLFTIAQRFNLTLAELQQANCIANADQIFSGQVLRVPFQLVESTATAAPTLTPPPGTAARADANFRADSTTLKAGECTILRWEAPNAQTVYLEGQPASASGSQQVCPQRSTRYTLLVIQVDGNQTPYFVSITVA